MITATMARNAGIARSSLSFGGLRWIPGTAPPGLTAYQRASPAATVARMTDHHDWTPSDITGMIANPFYAINIDEGLALPHEPMISEDDWIKANVNLINELGPEVYLRNLLSILKGNYPRG